MTAQFRRIADLESSEVGGVVDVIGVVEQVGI
jgi:hypothetical protein